MSTTPTDELDRDLRARANHQCELCESTDGLTAHEVPPESDGRLDRHVLLCSACSGDAPVDNHWNCLRSSIWSEVPAVQVVSWRLLNRLGQPWMTELLGEVYLNESVLTWAKNDESANREGADEPPTLDYNGAVLSEGDSVTIIKDLDAKGAGFVAKRGTVVKSIRLTGDPRNIEGRVNKTTLVLKTEFLKKA